jgi:membrane protease YdiL (CAAX protease family)
MIVDFVRRRPITAFLLWTYLVGQPIVLVPVIARSRGVELPTAPFVVVTTLVAVLVPALVITRITDGREAARRLLTSAADFRFGLRWYLLAVLGVPLLATAITVAFYGAPAAGTSVAWAIVAGLLVQTVVGLLLINLGEEVGWMGFVQARLQARRGPLVAALLTAPLFMLQHVTLLVDSLDVGALVVLALAIVVMAPFRMTLAWVWNRTGSLFAVGLVHAAGNAVAVGSGFGLGMLQRLYPGRNVGSMHILAFLVLGIAVAVATRGRLGRPAGEARRATTGPAAADRTPAPEPAEESRP